MKYVVTFLYFTTFWRCYPNRVGVHPLVKQPTSHTTVTYTAVPKFKPESWHYQTATGTFTH